MCVCVCVCVCDFPHIVLQRLQETEAEPLFAPDQSINETGVLSVMFFFSFSHLCIFDVSHHKPESEALMSPAFVRKKN